MHKDTLRSQYKRNTNIPLSNRRYICILQDATVNFNGVAMRRKLIPRWYNGITFKLISLS
jgi:hypothetical protein